MTDIPEIDIKTTLTVIEPNPNRLKILWAVTEEIEDGSKPDFDAEVLEATEEADKYRTRHVVHYEEPDDIGHDCIEVLPFLVGRPWDQCALNYVHSVQPSGIRVADPNTGITLDAQPWRVTVHLGNDYRTIIRIMQEVEVGCVGAKHGHGLSRYMHGESSAPVLGVYNMEGLRKLELFGFEAPAERHVLVNGTCDHPPLDRDETP